MAKKYKRTAEEVSKIKECDDVVIGIGPIYMSIARFHFALYRNIHQAFVAWAKSPTKIARQNELFYDNNGISVTDVGGFYHSFFANFPIGIPDNFPPIYSFAGKEDFNGKRIATVSRGNTRAIGCWRHGMYVMPTILIVHHFGDDSVVSKDILKDPSKWHNLSFDGEPSNNEEFFMKHAAKFSHLAFTSKIVKRDKYYIDSHGKYPYDFSIRRNDDSGKFDFSEDLYARNENYIDKIMDYCARSGIPMLDEDVEIKV